MKWNPRKFTQRAAAAAVAGAMALSLCAPALAAVPPLPALTAAALSTQNDNTAQAAPTLTLSYNGFDLTVTPGGISNKPGSLSALSVEYTADTHTYTFSGTVPDGGMTLTGTEAGGTKPSIVLSSLTASSGTIIVEGAVNELSVSGGLSCQLTAGQRGTIETASLNGSFAKQVLLTTQGNIEVMGCIGSEDTPAGWTTLKSETGSITMTNTQGALLWAQYGTLLAPAGTLTLKGKVNGALLNGTNAISARNVDANNQGVVFSMVGAVSFIAPETGSYTIQNGTGTETLVSLSANQSMELAGTDGSLKITAGTGISAAGPQLEIELNSPDPFASTLTVTPGSIAAASAALGATVKYGSNTYTISGDLSNAFVIRGVPQNGTAPGLVVGSNITTTTVLQGEFSDVTLTGEKVENLVFEAKAGSLNLSNSTATDPVRITLKDADIDTGNSVASQNGNAINFASAAQLTLTGENTVKGKIGIYSQNDLTIDGSGSLKVEGGGRGSSGIICSDAGTLAIKDGTITVTAENIGIGGPNVAISGGSLTASAGAFGISGTNGVEITGGNIKTARISSTYGNVTLSGMARVFLTMENDGSQYWNKSGLSTADGNGWLLYKKDEDGTVGGVPSGFKAPEMDTLNGDPADYPALTPTTEPDSCGITVTYGGRTFEINNLNKNNILGGMFKLVEDQDGGYILKATDQISGAVEIAIDTGTAGDVDVELKHGVAGDLTVTNAHDVNVGYREPFSDDNTMGEKIIGGSARITCSGSVIIYGTVAGALDIPQTEYVSVWADRAEPAVGGGATICSGGTARIENENGPAVTGGADITSSRSDVRLKGKGDSAAVTAANGQPIRLSAGDRAWIDNTGNGPAVSGNLLVTEARWAPISTAGTTAIDGNVYLTCNRVDITGKVNGELTYDQPEGKKYKYNVTLNGSLVNDEPLGELPYTLEKGELADVNSICINRTQEEISDEPVEPGDDAAGTSGGGEIGGAIAAVAVGGAAVWGGYEVATRVILNHLLPEGTAIPKTRGELALLVWQTAGSPEPANTPAFADVTDEQLAKAAQWCIEQGCMEARADGSFKPEGRTAKARVIQVWNKAFPKQ